MEDKRTMKKFLMLALPLVVFSGLANAAVPSCNSNPNAGVNLGTGNWFLADLVASGGCALGDKVWFGFGGAMDNAADVFNFGGPAAPGVGCPGIPSACTATYQMNINEGVPNTVLQGNFTFNYSLSIAPPPPAGLAVSLTRVTAGIQDNGNDGATLVKTITGGAACTASSTDSFGTITPGPCNGINAQSINVSEAFNYTANNSNPNGARSISGIGNTFVQTFVSTTGAPEPMSMLLFGSGLLGLSLIGRRKLIRK